MLNLCAFTLANGLDIAFVVILVIFSIVGAKKGFVASFFGFLSTIVALVAAFFLCDKVIGWTNGLFGLDGVIGGALTEMFGATEIMQTDISESGVAAAVEGMLLPAFLKTAIVEAIAVEGAAAGTTLAMLAGDVVAAFVLRSLTFLLIVILVKLFFAIFTGLFQKAADQWLMTQAVNSVLGALVGLVKGFIILSIVISIVGLLPIEATTAFFDQTLLLKEVYHSNPITFMLGLIAGA